jgi:hypothetical protein
MKALPSDEQIGEWKAECVEKAQDGIMWSSRKSTSHIVRTSHILGY